MKYLHIELNKTSVTLTCKTTYGWSLPNGKIVKWRRTYKPFAGWGVIDGKEIQLMMVPMLGSDWDQPRAFRGVTPGYGAVQTHIFEMRLEATVFLQLVLDGTLILPDDIGQQLVHEVAGFALTELGGITK